MSVRPSVHSRQHILSATRPSAEILSSVCMRSPHRKERDTHHPVFQDFSLWSRRQSRMASVHVALFSCWDLRVHDHEPLRAAHEATAKEGRSACVLHLLVLDELLGFGRGARPSREAGLPRLSAKRALFVLQSAIALSETLASRGYRLLVHVGSTVDALAAVARCCSIAAVHSHGPALCNEEQRIEGQIAAEHPLRLYWGWTLIHIDDLPHSMQRGHALPGRFKPFLDAVSRGKGPARHRPALAEPKWQAAGAPTALCDAIVACSVAKGDWGLASSPEALLPGSISDVAGGVAGGAAVTSELVAELSEASWRTREQPRGGEPVALSVLKRFVWEEDRLARYVGSSDSMTPGVDNALNATTRLSAYLSHGCLSARRLYDEVRAYERRRRRNRSTYWVYHELIMRDYLALSCLGWGIRLFSSRGPLDVGRGYAWRNGSQPETHALFRRWTAGRTGYPWVDAGMRQLAACGWMPHLLRQMCAAFLVRDLRVPWLWGAEWFELHLVDHTPDANYGNCVQAALPYLRLTHSLPVSPPPPPPPPAPAAATGPSLFSNFLASCIQPHQRHAFSIRDTARFLSTLPSLVHACSSPATRLPLSPRRGVSHSARAAAPAAGDAPPHELRDPLLACGT